MERVFARGRPPHGPRQAGEKQSCFVLRAAKLLLLISLGQLTGWLVACFFSSSRNIQPYPARSELARCRLPRRRGIGKTGYFILRVSLLAVLKYSRRLHMFREQDGEGENTYRVHFPLCSFALIRATHTVSLNRAGLPFLMVFALLHRGSNQLKDEAHNLMAELPLAVA